MHPAINHHMDWPWTLLERATVEKPNSFTPLLTAFSNVILCVTKMWHSNLYIAIFLNGMTTQSLYLISHDILHNSSTHKKHWSTAFNHTRMVLHFNSFLLRQNHIVTTFVEHGKRYMVHTTASNVSIILVIAHFVF